MSSTGFLKTKPRHCIAQRLHIDKTVDCHVVYCVWVDSGGPAQHVLEVNFVMITRTSINEQWGLIHFRVKYTSRSAKEVKISILIIRQIIWIFSSDHLHTGPRQSIF